MNFILIAVIAFSTALVPVQAKDSSQHKLDKVVIRINQDSIIDQPKVMELLKFTNSVFFISDFGVFDNIVFDKIGSIDYEINIASIYYFKNQKNHLVQGTILTETFEDSIIDQKIVSISEDINENLIYKDFSQPTPQ